MFTKEFLTNIRQLAFRKRVWFSSLNAVERGILSLSAKIINVVHSKTLVQQLTNIIDKLLNACKSQFMRNFEQHGLERAKMIQSQAEIFGYKGAEQLSENLDFIRYLMFLDYNQPIGRKIFE